MRADWFASRLVRNRWRYLRWAGLFEFLVSPDGRRVLYHRLPGGTAESFNTYLLGQVLSFSLLAFRVEPLHGTAVVADGKAIGLLGDCGSGKSTLGAAFLSRGYPLATDDLLALEPSRAGFAVHPGVPRIKLFPRVSRRVLGRDEGAVLNSGTSKRVLPLSESQACGNLATLSTLYVLGPPVPSRREPVIEPLSPGAALLEMIKHSFNTIVRDRARLAQQFRFAHRLVSRVPVKRLSYPRTLASLPEVCDAVLDDVNRS